MAPKPPDLPTAEEREWLGVELAETLSRMGADAFLHDQVIGLDPDDFPDPWEATPDGVGRLWARLLANIGLHDVKLQLRDVRDPAVERETITDICQFALVEVDRAEHRAVVELYGLHPLCRVQHAISQMIELAVFVYAELTSLDADADPYRGTSATPRELDEEEIHVRDIRRMLTAFGLGLGLLATGAAERVQHSGYSVGLWVNSSTQISRAGALHAIPCAYLLALQFCLQNDGAPLKDITTPELSPNQTKVFRDWYEYLAPQSRALAETLELHPEAEPVTDARTVETPAEVELLTVPEHQAAVAASPDATLTTFAHPVRNTGNGAILGAIVGAVAATIAGFAGLGEAWPLVFVAVFVAGTVTGYKAVFLTCSNPECARRLRSGQSRCPGCGRAIEAE